MALKPIESRSDVVRGGLDDRVNLPSVVGRRTGSEVYSNGFLTKSGDARRCSSSIRGGRVCSNLVECVRECSGVRKKVRECQMMLEGDVLIHD
jgi:hypothetical protein